MLCLVPEKIGFTRMSWTKLQLLLLLLQQCVSESIISDAHIFLVRPGVNPGGKRFTQTGHIGFCPEFTVTHLDGHLLMRVALGPAVV